MTRIEFSFAWRKRWTSFNFKLKWLQRLMRRVNVTMSPLETFQFCSLVFMVGCTHLKAAILASCRSEAVRRGHRCDSSVFDGEAISLVASLLLVAMPGAPSSVLAPKRKCFCMLLLNRHSTSLL